MDTFLATLVRKRDVSRAKVTRLRCFMIRSTMIKIRFTEESLLILSRMGGNK